MPFAGALLALPYAFEPAKALDPLDVAALEQAGLEVGLEAPHLGGGVTLVPARTGRTDRSEITFREAAILRLIVDCFPGSHIVGYRSGPVAAASPVEPGNRSGQGLPAAAAGADDAGRGHPPAPNVDPLS
jgi:hypothetical protein